MITKSTDADVVVVSLIGERVENWPFTKEILNSHSKDKVVVVAVRRSITITSDTRAKRATAIAEYFRDLGKDILLITDSLTRVAHAQRAWASSGEQPTSRGYLRQLFHYYQTLSSEREQVLKTLVQLLLFILFWLMEDTASDPVVDTARAILDGHIVLSRDLAQQGIYPAIDVNQSISRLMNDIVDPRTKNAQLLRKYLLKYNENRDLVLMGGYVQGQDPGWIML